MLESAKCRAACGGIDNAHSHRVADHTALYVKSESLAACQQIASHIGVSVGDLLDHNIVNPVALTAAGKGEDKIGRRIPGREDRLMYALRRIRLHIAQEAHNHTAIRRSLLIPHKV